MRLEVRCEDRVGMAREILDLLIPYHIDMRRIEVDSQIGCLYVGFEDIAFDLLTRLLGDIRRLRGVSDVKTVHFTPSEQEQNAVMTLLETLPDGVVAVDLKGKVTMATAQAARDLGVALHQLLLQPLQGLIPSVAFDRLDWQTGLGLTKRVRLNGQLVLLEMQPFFVTDDGNHRVCAGGVIYLRSAKRLGRQASNMRKAPNAEHLLSSFVENNVTKSPAMLRCLEFAVAYLGVEQPMLLTGEFAVGKKRLLEAVFHAWQDQYLEPDAVLQFVAAQQLDIEQLAQCLQVSGWLAITEVEMLAQDVQQYLTDWIEAQASQLHQEQAPIRVIGVSCMSPQALRHQSTLQTPLLYQLQSFQLNVPPLRERKEDLAGLAANILAEAAERDAIEVSRLSSDALATIKLHDWPGNLKELESCLLQSLVAHQGAIITALDLPLQLNQSMPIELIEGSLDKTVKAYEAQLLRKLYPEYPSTRKLAKFLQVSHSSIANKLKEYGIV